MTKIGKAIASLTLIFLATTGVVSGQIQSAERQNEALRNVEKFGRALLYITNSYLDTTNSSALTDKAISEMLSTLDPHSVYIPAKDVKKANEQLDASFEGVGIEFAIINDTLTVQAPIQGGPCESVGIMAGDKIVWVDGTYISGKELTNEKVQGYLRGEKGTKVSMKVVRKGVSDTLFFNVTRAMIPITSVDAAYLVSEDVLYIRLSRFAMTSMFEVLEGFKLCKKYPKGIILDLRGNSGGYLHIALQLSNLFLSAGETILYTEGLNSPKREEFANGKGLYPTGPLVVLIDEGSASASEIVAGAMQDWDRATIIGRRSFGKGLVQQMFTLPDGAQMRLTTARYHTPSGRVIQTPYQMGHREEYYKKSLERYLSGELYGKDTLQYPDSLKFKTLKKGRTVYGGGGITPDIFIPRDTTGISKYYVALINRGLLTEFINKYYDSHRDSLKAVYPDFDTFYAKYGLADELYNGLIEYASENGLEYNEAEAQEARRLIDIRTKALIARSLFDMNSYFKVINREDDPEFKKALEVIL